MVFHNEDLQDRRAVQTADRPQGQGLPGQDREELRDGLQHPEEIPHQGRRLRHL